jgi:hypothetical protein
METIVSDDHGRAGGKVRQVLHSITGDRDREAKALADRAGDDVDEEDARRAVQKAEGDLGKDEPAAPDELATPEDAQAEARDHPHARR